MRYAIISHKCISRQAHRPNGSNEELHLKVALTSQTEAKERPGIFLLYVEDYVILNTTVKWGTSPQHIRCAECMSG
jgi:predicted metal-dependent phosphoesterase TrpH